MREWLPQRHKWRSKADRTSANLGCGVVSKRETNRMINPAVQYPHCAACSSMKACWTGCKLASGPRPSRVVTLRPLTALAGNSQEFSGLPSTRTVQAPQCPVPQPYLVARNSKRLRNMFRSETLSTAWTVTARPFTENSILLNRGLTQL